MYPVSTKDSIDLKATGLKRVLQNVANCMRTIRGEVPLLREMGLGEMIDSPITDSLGVSAKSVINEIEKYEPRVKVKKVYLDQYFETFEIKVEVEVLRID